VWVLVAAERKGESVWSTRVEVETRLRRERRREERVVAEGEEETERRRVGESRMRWILRVGWAEEREVRRVVRVVRVVVGEGEMR
jgi:hypothetical protein